MKNGFVFAPLIFAFRLQDPRSLARAFTAFAAFCLASSAVYALNDIADRARDRAHPLKRHRPVASGRVTPLEAGIVSATAVTAAMVMSVFCGRHAVIAVLGAYLLLNGAYSAWLKRFVILDVISISAGFVLRVLAGAVAIDVPLSPWMMLTTFFLSLFLGFTKRRSELRVKSRAEIRGVLREYSESLLATLVTISASLTIVAYALSVIQPKMTGRSDRDFLLYTVPLVVYGLLRYLYLSMRRGLGDDTSEVILRDPPLLVTVVLWIGVVVLLVTVYE